LLLLFSGSRGHVLRLKEQRNKQIFSLAFKLEQELEEPAFGRDILSQAQLLQLLVEMGRSMDDAVTNLPRPSVPKNRLSAFSLTLQVFITATSALYGSSICS
jgi:hypothetical protein